MPKVKSNRSAAKRFTATGAGKIRRRQKNMRHILTKKSPKRKRQLRQVAYVDKANEKQVRRQLPYLGK